jgi:hypothetical protein
MGEFLEMAKVFTEKNKLKIIIAGGRDFEDREFFDKTLEKILSPIKIFSPERVEIVSGHCSGVDTMAEEWSKERGYNVKPFPVTKEEWKKFGLSAGPMRNRKMAKYADALIAFWDQKSRGTKSMIDIARKEGLSVIVIDTSK